MRSSPWFPTVKCPKVRARSRPINAFRPEKKREVVLLFCVRPFIACYAQKRQRQTQNANCVRCICLSKEKSRSGISKARKHAKQQNQEANRVHIDGHVRFTFTPECHSPLRATSESPSITEATLQIFKAVVGGSILG